MESFEVEVLFRCCVTSWNIDSESSDAIVPWSLPVSRVASTVAEKWLSITPEDVGTVVQQMQSVILGSPAAVRG